MCWWVLRLYGCISDLPLVLVLNYFPTPDLCRITCFAAFRWLLEVLYLIAVSTAVLGQDLFRSCPTEVWDTGSSSRITKHALLTVWLEGYHQSSAVYTRSASTVTLKEATSLVRNNQTLLGLPFSSFSLLLPLSLHPCMYVYLSRCLMCCYLLWLNCFPSLLCPCVSSPLSDLLHSSPPSLHVKRKLLGFNIWCVWIAHKQVSVKSYQERALMT